jgi:ornithine carbamoyltransferase
VRHFLDVDDLSPDELVAVLDRAEVESRPPLLAGRSVGLLFQKPSLRTRHSCEVAVIQLGGHPLTFFGQEVSPDTREPMSDIAKVLGGYHAALGARVFDHGRLVELADTDALPVINLLSDDAHPCQALADLLTVRQRFGSLDGRIICWIGDYNNTVRSLARGAAMLGVELRIASPPGYGPAPAELDYLGQLGGSVDAGDDPAELVKGADVVATDVWTSMGFENEDKIRRDAFARYQVDELIMLTASPDAVFMHCLPAHRGEEVVASVVDGPQSVVFAQAHNRLASFRGLLWWLIETNESPDR